ncbi:acetoacetate--CoA ligase [Nocardioides currus]|uniref:Acetoacetate--CoA ligase n=1 Tax=Nocardioides currus TaxID=2133958 RepID=A0A2R7YT91_9ACTN|nr:acetoacetate--CoA ligase [Nocardioides currus]PUA79514.1 acetoacetate--CoA ligase [Nocardioides currus]
MSAPTEPAPVWQPDPSTVASSAITRFAEDATARTGRDLSDYRDLWSWSVEDLDGFWSSVWTFFDVQADGSPARVLTDEAMPGATWFPDVRLNYAEQALRHALDPALADSVAVTSIGEDGDVTRTTWRELRQQVGAVAGWLRNQGVEPGTRVVGYLPNTTPTLVAFLATASIGAIWSACAQDYSGAGAATRFAQLEPTVLIAADGYRWNGRAHDRRAEVDALRDALPTLRAVVHVPNLGLEPPPGATSWAEVTDALCEPRFDRLTFDAPLWVLFSSGTTGVPKGIVHGHGGVLLEHLKTLGLHMDLGPGRPLFWYTTTNWMMWNLVASGLLVGAPVVLYDGSPAHPGPDRLWRIAADERAHLLGVSPGYLLGSAQADLWPGRDLDLSSLRTIGATGAPVTAASYHWVAEHVGANIQLASTTGGTDVVAGFAGSAPTTPVWPGEISAPNLGVALESWSSDGEPVVGEVGELVVTRPMPSMPVFFWNDPDEERYRDSYFSTYPGVWRHGDWMEVTDRGSLVVSGRSDSTLNRHGVRLGSADIYATVDRVPEIRESLVIGAELGDGGYWLVLFVVLADGIELTDDLVSHVTGAIRAGASPRHVPDDVIAVPAIPHTRTGKKLEIPVKRLIQGHPLDKVASKDAVDDFEALARFQDFSRLTTTNSENR